MFLKTFLSAIFYLIFFEGIEGVQLTFKNVVVTCESSKKTTPNGQGEFAITVTGNSLKPHLYPGMDCFSLEIKHSVLPVLYEDSLANITRVNILLLEDNAIEQIYPGAFKDTAILGGMSLKGNKLTEIRSGVFNGLKVPILYLSYNIISTLHPAAFDNMAILEHLFLDNNRLYSIDSNWFKNSPKLNRIDFRNNLIGSIPAYAFKNILMGKSYSVDIDLSGNQIGRIDKNALKAAVKPARFFYLRLSHNQIQNLDSTWLNDVVIRNLDLSYNKIQCLNAGTLAGPYSTNYIDGMFWFCDCLRRIKAEEGKSYGKIVADESFERCKIPN